VSAPQPNAAVQSAKHWRAFGREEWGHVRDGAVGLALGGVLPVALFYVGFRAFSFPVAVTAVLVWSAGVFAWHWRRTGGADVFSAATFGFACLQALVGLVSRSPALYLAWPTIENLLYGAVFFGSALAGHPLLGLYARRLYPLPPTVQDSPTFKRALLVVSALWLVGLGLRGAVRLVLLAILPLEVYLVANTVAGWPFHAGLVILTVWYPLRALRHAGLLADAPPVVGDVEEAVEETVAGVP
jgi:intracellular septation protein A